MKRALVLSALLFWSLGLWSADWPHWRGPGQTGAVDAEAMALGKTFGFEVVWKRPLGSGYSQISIAGDTGVTMFTDGTSDILMAFETATGKEKWRHVLGPMYKGHSGSDDGPTGTPTIDGDMVFAIGPHGDLVAVTLADGQLKWSRKLGEDVAARVPHYGFNTVPTLVDGKVIVMTGDEEGKAFTALNRENGEVLWRSGNDTSTYQSPFVWTRGGKERILGVTDHYLMELDPADGNVLWQAEHKVLDNENYGMPIFFGENQLLILNRRGAAGFSLDWNGNVASMTELWRSNVYQQTYALPVVHQGLMFGFRGQILTAIQPESGEIVWRSRPPGGLGLSLIGGHLVVAGKDGDLVAIPADGNGYREVARIPLFERTSYTPASYADGHLYIRDLSEMAAIRIVERATLAQKEVKGPELKGEFGAFVRQVMASNDKKNLVESYFKDQKSFPITEGNLVHYVYRGEVEDMAVSRGFGDEVPMTRVEGTDLFFFTEELDADSHWEYHYSVYGERMLDPRNPHIIGEGQRARNELRMPQWKVPDFFHAPRGPVGSVAELELDSKTLGGKRKVDVYLPAGYEGSDKRYPLLVVNDNMIRTRGAMQTALDNLIGRQEVAPVIVAFVARGDRAEFTGEKRDVYAQFITSELLPQLDRDYRTKTGAANRMVMGIGTGAVAAVYASITHPGVFGKVSTQSFVVPPDFHEGFFQQLDTAKPGTSYFVEISTNDYEFSGYDAEADSRRLAESLKTKGNNVRTKTTAGAPGIGHWRSGMADILSWMAPGSKKGDM